MTYQGLYRLVAKALYRTHVEGRLKAEIIQVGGWVVVCVLVLGVGVFFSCVGVFGWGVFWRSVFVTRPNIQQTKQQTKQNLKH